MSMNALREYTHTKRYKQREELFQTMKAYHNDSFLWSADISNYKEYPIDKIAKEILWIAPFRSKELRVLIKYVKRRMTRTKHVKWKKEPTKPHRGDLHKAIQREFIKYRSKERQAKQQEIADIESDIVSNKIIMAAIEFDIELIKTIYGNNVPKTDAAYREDQIAYKRMIELYESEGNCKTAQTLKDNPLSPKPTYRDIAYKLEADYLKKHHDLPKQKFKEALHLKIKEVSEFAYPRRKHTHPTEEDQPNDDF